MTSCHALVIHPNQVARAKISAPQNPAGAIPMPAKSKAQQQAAGAALAAKRGDKKQTTLRGASKQMAKSMSEKELEKMAARPRKGKPDHSKSKSH
jgi:hypothetical protein